MKVLAINSSPNKDNGNTALILNSFLKGMKESGAEIELVFTRDLEIRYCRSCFNCWFNTPGKCPQKDDMQKLYPKLREADLWVIASPVYVDGVSGPMKMLFDRILPLVEPFIENRDDHCRHPLRDGTKKGKVVLVSNSGFWEIDNFDPLVAWVKAVCKNANREFAGAILRPHGMAMVSSVVPKGDIIKASERAGIELIHNKTISADTLKKISRPLLPKNIYIFFANRNFKKRINKKK